jgi:hypothetical protein
MINNCPVCGKAFDVLWPQLWKYKRDGGFICSYTCMRAYDRKDGNEMTSISKEQKAKAIQIALDGGDPKPYLKECGSKAPDKLWYYIKNTLKVKDPETYEHLAKGARKKTVETPEGEFATLKLDGPIRIQTKEPEKVEVVETPEKKPELPPITAPVVYDGMIVREVEGLFGRYRYTDIGSAVYIDFENVDRMDTLSFTVDQWRKFREEQEKAAKILGVEL